MTFNHAEVIILSHVCPGKPSSLDDATNPDWAPNVVIDNSAVSPSIKKLKITDCNCADNEENMVHGWCQTEPPLRCDASTQYDTRDFEKISSVTLKGNLKRFLSR